MASGIGVQVEGLRETVRALERAGVEVDDLKDVFSDIAATGARIVKPLTPVRSGALAGSVRGNRAKNKAVITAGNGRRIPYAGPQNYGWRRRNITPKLFMQKGDARISPIAVEKLDAGLGSIIRKVGLE